MPAARRDHDTWRSRRHLEFENDDADIVNSVDSSMFNPPHPGRMLAESLRHLQISPRDFARHIVALESSVIGILGEQIPITPDMALRISAALPGPSLETWLALQAEYDLWQARNKVSTARIKRIEVPTNHHVFA